MNERKAGRPFDFHDSYIEFLAFFKVGFDAPNRMLEGVVEAFAEYISRLSGTSSSPRSREGLSVP